MAAILKAPVAAAPGVVTFTTQERDRVFAEAPEVRKALEAIKDNWLVGLHHNWHDHSFRYDPLFDFSMAGEDDLREVKGRPFPLLPLDACNFTPEVFRPGGEPFWDVLFVARAVYFKRIPEFFAVIRTLYDRGHEVRVLLLSPVPPYAPGDAKTAFYDIRTVYEEMFDQHEQDLFTLLTMDWRYPFPLDLPTLAHFYRSSRVFVHTADDERRCRVAAYAWTSGLPVVGPEPIGSLLSPALRKPPWFYRARRDAEFPALVLEALETAPLGPAELEAVGAEVAARSTRPQLVRELSRIAADRGLEWNDEALALERLDIRLGRHHGLGDAGPNRVEASVEEFIAALAGEAAHLRDAVAQPDPERVLAQPQPRQRDKRRFLRR
jgi:glycosyltransferase involved in cell wall biosynthesis